MLSFVTEQIDRIGRHEYLPLLIVTACIQGGIVISQFIAAFILSPSEIGVVRSMESALSVLILMGSFGAQTLSIREVARSHHARDKIQILKNVFVVTIFGATIMVCGVSLFHAISSKSVLLDAIASISGLILLTNAVRAASGFTQGAGLVGKTYQYLIVSTVAALGVHAILTSYWGVQGWIIGRYIGEFLILAVLMALIGRYIGPISWREPISLIGVKSLLSDGSKINTSLVIKLIADNLPVLMMAALKLPTDKIGFVGLAILTINSAMLPIAVVVQRFFPIMTKNQFRQTELISQSNQLLALSLRLAVFICVALFVLSICLYRWFSGIYAEAFLLTAILCWTIPLKSIALAYGTNLVATNQLSVAIKINSVEAVLLVFIGWAALSLWGSIGIVCTVFLACLWSAAAYRAVVAGNR